MTEMEWLKEQKERIESAIKMHENCLNILRPQLGVVFSIIAQKDGQPDGALGCPANQSCER